MKTALNLFALVLASTSLIACDLDDDDDDNDGDSILRGPDDGRAPELGNDPSVVMRSKVTMAQGLMQAEATGPVIEAKFELDHEGALSLSTYPVGAPLAMDSERSKFQELAGDPTAAVWQPSLAAFHDFEHLTRSSRDLTLVQLSALSLKDAVARVGGFVYWAVPTIHEGRAGYGVFSLDDGKSSYQFVDGGGDRTTQVVDLGTGPGTAATDARTPKLGDNLAVLREAKITMSAALAQAERDFGTTVEAKFEIEDGELSLSVYPVSDAKKPAEANTLMEVAGSPTTAAWTPTKATFAEPDEEHLTRAARDLTIVQTANLSLRDAVTKAEAQISGGIVYWAIPTRRGTTAGYGVYVLAPDNSVHYLFIS